MIRFHATPARVALAACLVASLAGCGDRKAANKDNFKQALAAHFRDHCIFVTPSVGLNAFPVSVSDDAETARFDALVHAGLLVSKAAANEHSGPLGIGTVREQQKTYTLTDKGRGLFQDGAPGERGFCAGHYKVTEIEGFTQPADEAGRQVSNVTFDVTPDMESWVEDKAVQARYGNELAQVKPTTDHAKLVLTDKGWVPASDVGTR